MLSLCRHFADDNCIQYSSQNEHNINHGLLVLEQWSSKWLLRFNRSKTNTAFLTLKSSYELPEIFFQHCQLEYITTHKHLGLHLASDLKWANHKHFYVNKAYNTLGLLKTLKFNLAKYFFQNCTLFLVGFFLNMLLLFGMAADKAKRENDKKKVQLCAASIVTGPPIIALKIFVSRDRLANTFR